MKKTIWGIMLFLCIFQLIIANRVVYHDDVIFISFITNSNFFDTELNAHPSLPIWFDNVFTIIFGVYNWSFRLTSIIFTTAAVYLVYLFAKERTNEITGIVAALLVGLSAWHIRASQMNSGSDGGMFSFFFLLTLFFLFKSHRESDKKRYVLYTGISLGLAFLSKETAFLLIPILVIFMILNKYEYKQIIKNIMIIIILGGFVFSVFPILDYVYNNGETIHAITSRIESVATGIEGNYGWSFLQVYSLFKVLIWVGPLLLFFLLNYIIDGKYTIIKDPLFICINIVFLFYLTCVPPTLDKARYLMVLISPIGILVAEYIMKKKEEYIISNKDIIISSIVSMLCLSVFLVMNSSTHVISYESSENPLTLLKTGKTAFSIPLFTETDNSGFLINFQILLITAFLTTTCFVIMVFKRNCHIYLKRCFLIILIVGSAYNFIVLEEYAFHLTSPNYSDAIKELVVYGQEHELKQPLYLLKNYELQYYFADNYTNFITTYGLSDTNPEKITQFQQEIETTGGTIIFTDMPPIDRDGLLWQMINTCRKNVTVTDKGIEIGYVFTC